jgi:hypothetical protein
MKNNIFFTFVLLICVFKNETSFFKNASKVFNKNQIFTMSALTLASLGNFTYGYAKKHYQDEAYNDFYNPNNEQNHQQHIKQKIEQCYNDNPNFFKKENYCRNLKKYHDAKYKNE